MDGYPTKMKERSVVIARKYPMLLLPQLLQEERMVRRMIRSSDAASKTLPTSNREGAWSRGVDGMWWGCRGRRSLGYAGTLALSALRVRRRLLSTTTTTSESDVEGGGEDTTHSDNSDGEDEEEAEGGHSATDAVRRGVELTFLHHPHTLYSSTGSLPVSYV